MGNDLKGNQESAVPLRESLDADRESLQSAHTVGVDILARLKATQCCDVAINGLLGAAIEEIERLRAALYHALDIVRQNDILRWELKADLERHLCAALERKP